MKSINLILSVIFITLSATTAKHLYESRIVNGKDAVEGQFPHMASLHDKTDLHFCGASILSNRFLLTAAHCCLDSHSNPENVYALVGTIRQSSGGVRIGLDTVIAHKKFDMGNLPTAKYDVAVLRTATEIIFTDLIQPIALPKVNLPEDRHVKVVLSGWGLSGGSPDVLQFSEPDGISINECIERFGDIPRYKNVVSKGNVCTFDSKKQSGACSGDSGSGLVDVSDPNHKTVVGIASWVYPCAQGYPDVFARVYTSLDWIHEQIENHSGDLGADDFLCLKNVF